MAVFLDRYSRQVVGPAMSVRMAANLVFDALRMARWRRHPGKGLLVYSDRGSQYASGCFQALQKDQGYLSASKTQRRDTIWNLPSIRAKTERRSEPVVQGGSQHVGIHIGMGRTRHFVHIHDIGNVHVEGAAIVGVEIL
jgi:transposase InsO family protein